MWSACALTVCGYLTMYTFCPISWVFHLHVFFVLAVRPWLKAPDFSKPAMNCKISFIHVLKTVLVDTAGLILEDHVMCLAFCWKDVVILIGLGTHFYCHFVVCAWVAGNEQELWESATFHSKPHEYCIYLNVNDHFLTSSEKWGITLKSRGELGVLFISMFVNI